jgi:hypothetical protein
LVGGRDAHFAAINLCRRLQGSVLWRYADAIVIEVEGGADLAGQLERLLPFGQITHRSWVGAAKGAMPSRRRHSPLAKAKGIQRP